MNALPLRILRFWPEYKPNPDGTLRAIDMIAYCAPGMAHMRVTVDAVSRLAKVRPYTANSEDEAAKLANLRWNAIKPAYDAWKKGEELPDSGTPLSAWLGITAEESAIVKQAGIRSVEELANANDTVLGHIKLPRVRDLREGAKMFVASKDQNATAMRVEAAEKKSAELESQLEEMRKILLDMQSEKQAAIDAAAAAKQQQKQPKEKVAA